MFPASLKATSSGAAVKALGSQSGSMLPPTHQDCAGTVNYLRVTSYGITFAHFSKQTRPWIMNCSASASEVIADCSVWGVIVKCAVWRGIVDNYRHFNCFRSLNCRSPGMRRGRRKLKACWAKEASKIACHELTLCVLGSFLRDQSRVKGGDIIFQRPRLSLPPQLLLPGEKFLEKLPPVCVLQRWIPTETLSLSLASPPLAPALLPLGRKVPRSMAWSQGSVDKQEPAEHPHLQIFLHGNEFGVKITEFGSWSKSRQQLRLPLSWIQTTLSQHSQKPPILRSY